MFGLGPLELLVVVICVVLLFGPSLVRRAGDTAKEIRKITKEIEK